MMLRYANYNNFFAFLLSIFVLFGRIQMSKPCLQDSECQGAEGANVPMYCSLLTGTCAISTMSGDTCGEAASCGPDEKGKTLGCIAGRCRAPNAPALGVDLQQDMALLCRTNRDCALEAWCDGEAGGLCRARSDLANQSACPRVDGLLAAAMQRNSTQPGETPPIFYNLGGACESAELCDFVQAQCARRCRVPERPYAAALVSSCQATDLCDPQCPAGMLCAAFDKLFSYSNLPVDPQLSLDGQWLPASNPANTPVALGICVSAGRIRVGSLAEKHGSRLRMRDLDELQQDAQQDTTTDSDPGVSEPHSPDDSTQQPHSGTLPSTEQERPEPVPEEEQSTKLLYISIGAGFGGLLILFLFIYLIIWSRKKAAARKKDASLDATQSSHIVSPSSPVYSSAPPAAKDKKATGLFDLPDEAVPAYVPPPPGSSYIPDYKKPL
jgi:hypothetical protein